MVIRGWGVGGVLKSLTRSFVRKSHRTIVAGTQQMVHGNTWKNGDQCPCFRPASVQKKILLGLQLRHNFALLQSVSSALPKSLWQCSVESREICLKWLGWSNIIIFLCFLKPLKRKIASPLRPNAFFLLSHTPANRGSIVPFLIIS